MSVEPKAQKPPETSRAQKWSRRLWWLHSFWALAVGAAVVYYADQSFDEARWLTVGLIAVWLIIVVFYRIFGREPLDGEQTMRRKMSYVAFTFVLKNLYQGMLFFLLPFYWRSTTFGTTNQWFLIGLSLMAILATLDLFFDRILMARRALASSYFIFALFAALNLAIPSLWPALDARWALLMACVASMATFWVFNVRLTALTDKRWLGALVASLAFAAAAPWWVRSLVPPVPHHMVRGAVGMSDSRGLQFALKAIRADRFETLEARTRVLAPGGPESEFHHVWRFGGDEIHRVEETIREKTEDNIVTVSSELPPGAIPKDAVGRWSVDVETTDGRLIGRVRFRVFPARTE